MSDWIIPIASVSINLLLLILRYFAPKLPGWSVPLINVIIGALVSYLASIGVHFDLPSTLVNTAAISGSAALTHNLVKNIVRQDSFGQAPNQ